MIVALRATPVFGCAVTVTAPLPVPAPLRVTHAAPEDAVHEHALAVITVTVAEPPGSEKLTEVGETL